MAYLSIPDERRYFHFIAEWLTIVFQEYLENGPLDVVYDGPYDDLLKPFSRTLRPEKPLMGRLRESTYRPSPLRLREISERVKNHYSVGRAITQPCITIIKRRNNRCWAREKDLIETIRSAHPHMETTDVFLEDMEIVEQIRLMHRTSVLIGVHGAGLANIIFMQPGGSVIEVNPDSFWFEWYIKVSARLSLNHVCINSEIPAERDFSMVPETVLRLFRDRKLDTSLFLEINERLSHHPKHRDDNTGYLFRSSIRDVPSVPVSSAQVSALCTSLLCQ